METKRLYCFAPRTMKASELIAKLQEMMDTYGDCEVFMQTPRGHLFVNDITKYTSGSRTTGMQRNFLIK